MKHIALRLLQMLLIVSVLSVGLFGVLTAMPGNPVDMLISSNPRIKPEDVARLKKLRGLDKPWYVQYVRWMWGYYDDNPNLNEAKFTRGFIFFFAGDNEALGFSSTYKRPIYELLAGDPARSNISEGIENRVMGWFLNSGRIGNTLQLMIPAFLLSLLIAIPLGVLSAYWQYFWLDYIVNFFAFIGISLPIFWVAIMAIFVFAEYLQWLPAGGMQTPEIQNEGLWAVISDRVIHSLLPVSVLSIAYVGQWLRYIRSSMLEVLPQDYIRTARAKGLAESVVVFKHAFRNALIPVVTILSLSVPALFGGAVLTETVFSWPGIGRLQYDAVMNSDYYVAIVVFLISSVLVIIGNLLADILYVLVDPRIRHG